MNNGKNGWVLKLLATVLCTVILSALTGILTAHDRRIESNDKDSIKRDLEMNTKFTTEQMEQRKVNQEILVTLKEIQTDIKYIKGVQ